jgi:haloalkane dehalogenase
VGNPGALISPAYADSFAKRLKNCRVVQLRSGLHYLQEDHPDVIGANIKEWLMELGIGSIPEQMLRVGELPNLGSSRATNLVRGR